MSEESVIILEIIIKTNYTAFIQIKTYKIMNNTYDSKLPTGFTPIDEVVEGFHYGNLVTLAGRPCMRTEYFSYTMMRNWIQNDMIDEGFVFFSLINKRNDIAKLISELCNTDSPEAQKWGLE